MAKKRKRREREWALYLTGMRLQVKKAMDLKKRLDSLLIYIGRNPKSTIRSKLNQCIYSKLN